MTGAERRAALALAVAAVSSGDHVSAVRALADICIAADAAINNGVRAHRAALAALAALATTVPVAFAAERVNAPLPERRKYSEKVPTVPTRIPDLLLIRARELTKVAGKVGGITPTLSQMLREGLARGMDAMQADFDRVDCRTDATTAITDEDAGDDDSAT